MSATSTDAFTLLTAKSGARVRWSMESVEVIADESIDEIDPAAMDAVEAAFATWAGVVDAYPTNVVVRRGVADEIGYRPGQVNHSTIRYRPDGYSMSASALAITVLTYSADGTIVDADIII